MSENDTTEAPENVDVVEPTFLESLEQMKSFEDMATARGDEAEETSTDDDPEVDAEADTSGEPDPEPDPDPETAAPFLTLSDGTGVTKEEAIAGYTRHLDYTQKTMEHSKQVKELEPYMALIDRMKTDDTLFNMVDKYIREGGQAEKDQAQAAQDLQVPDSYKGDVFVEQTVAALNATTKRLDALEGGVGSIKQDATDKQKRGEAEAIYHGRLQDAFTKLKGQLSTEISPKDFINRMKTHFEGKGLTPEQYMPMIIGPDSTYLSANVTEAYRSDVDKVVKDKVNSEREKRKPKGADKRALKATGKPAKTVSQKSPKLTDGRLDRKAHFRNSPVQKLSSDDLG